ncbi:molecular chaperone TorD family protein [Azospirillum sp. ST 5-10]|uniref:molecular chaperone TorD family protein n=1 Tax=unclassified Azospirillum TaxID=2630922 RepID=UPI003F4A8365
MPHPAPAPAPIAAPIAAPIPAPLAAAVMADAVAVLAALFGAPLDERDVAAVRRPVDRGALAPLAAVPVLRPGVEEAAAIVRRLGDTPVAVSRLNREFCRLFLGAGGRMTAAPYESAYRGSGRLYQEPAGEMAALLRRRDRRAADGFPEAPDHLVIELALLEDALRLPGAEDTATAEALLARLRRWVPAFAAACRLHDGTGFYAEAAGVLAALLAAGESGAAPSPA